MPKFLLKHNILWLLMGLIIGVGIITTIASAISFVKTKSTNHEFPADDQMVQYPGSTLKNFRGHEIQKYFEKLMEMKLRLRSAFIRLDGQIYYSLFKRSFAENSQIIIGKDKQLFQEWYIMSYCKRQNVSWADQAQLVAWANQIKELNNYFKSHGKAFLYLITPSKAEYMPEFIPERFHCINRGIDSHIHLMKKLLDDRNIPYLDAATLMVDATKTYGTSMFPKGGTHWNWLGSSLAANALINNINQTGNVRLNQLRFNYHLIKINQRKSRDYDDDLLQMVKLIRPGNYIVPEVNFFTPPAKPKAVSVALVGGSFNYNLIDIFMQNATFAKIDYYFYFNRKKTLYEIGKKPVTEKVDLLSKNLLDPIIKADLVILEENTSLTLSSHGKLFYDMMKDRGFILEKHL